MRIVSQNKKIDVDYDNVILTYIQTNFDDLGVKYYDVIDKTHNLRLGTYETKERALEIMEVIRLHYENIRKAEFYDSKEEYSFYSNIFEMPKK